MNIDTLYELKDWLLCIENSIDEDNHYKNKKNVICTNIKEICTLIVTWKDGEHSWIHLSLHIDKYSDNDKVPIIWIKF